MESLFAFGFKRSHEFLFVHHDRFCPRLGRRTGAARTRYMADMAGRIYLDWNATTPLRHEARAAMAHAWEISGNPSSVHAEGRAARSLVERARPVIIYETLLDCFDHFKLIAIERWLLERNYELALLHPQHKKLQLTRYPRFIEDTVAFPAERAQEFRDFII